MALLKFKVFGSQLDSDDLDEYKKAAIKQILDKKKKGICQSKLSDDDKKCAVELIDFDLKLLG